MFAVRCFGALVAVYVRDVLNAGTGIFGALSSMVGVGMIIGTQFMHRFGRNRSKAHVVVAGLLGLGIMIAVVAAIPNTPAAAVGMLGMGLCAAFLFVPAQTLLQEETPPQMLGRVGGSMMSVMMSAQVAGLSIAGPVAGFIGIRNLYFASAALLGVLALAGHLRLRHHVPPAARAADASSANA
jgi:MFS family permease